MPKTSLTPTAKRLRPYPAWCCVECGLLHQKAKSAALSGTSTCHTGSCRVCGAKGVAVTEPRDFGYPRFPGFKEPFEGEPIPPHLLYL